MATGDKKTNFAQKRFLSQQRFEDTFFDYLQGLLREITSRVWANRRGVFGVSLDFSIGVADEFSITPLPQELLDGGGNILTLAAADASGIRFENTNAVVYSVGARHSEIPSGTIRNPRTGLVDYDQFEDRIGVSADPNSVAEVAGQLQVVCDSVFEVGVSHAGRKVTVYMKKPVTDVETDAIERDVVVTFTGGQNLITTSGLLGQNATAASTDPADYTVVAQGVTVRRNTDLSSVDPFAFLGTVTGGGLSNPPSSKSTTGQIDVTDGINPDLQSAYNLGRTIVPSSSAGGAVKIASTDSGDAYRSLLHLDRVGATEKEPVGLVSISDVQKGVTQLNLVPIQETGSNFLQQFEPAQLDNVTDGDIDLTRGGVDASGAGADADADLVVLSGFATASINRMFMIDTVGSTTLSIRNLDGSTPSPWPGTETGSVSFFRSRFVSGAGSFANGKLGLSGENAFNGLHQPGGDSAVKILPFAATNAIKIFDSAKNVRFVVDKDGKLSARDTTNERFVVETDGQIVVRDSAAAEKLRINNSGQAAFKEAASVEAPTTAADGHNATFRVRRTGTPGRGTWLFEAIYGSSTGIIPLALLGEVDIGNTTPNAACQKTAVAGQILVTEGGGWSFQESDTRLTNDLHVILVQTTDEASEGSVFVFQSGFTATVADLLNFDGSTPAPWTNGATGTLTVLEPLVLFGNSSLVGGAAAGFLSHWDGYLFNMRTPTASNTGPLRILPHYHPGNVLEIMNNASNDAPGAEKAVVTYQPSLIADDDAKAYPLKIRNTVHIDPGQDSIYDFSDAWNSLRVRGPAKVTDTGDETWALSFGTQSMNRGGFDGGGTPYRPHEFFDDFLYDSACPTPTNNIQGSPGPYLGGRYHYSFIGNGRVGIVPSSNLHVGQVRVENVSTVNGITSIESEDLFRINSEESHQWVFECSFRFRNSPHTNARYRIGLFSSGSANNDAWLQYDSTVSPNFVFHYTDPDGGGIDIPATFTYDTGVAPVASEWNFFYMAQLGSIQWVGQIWNGNGNTNTWFEVMCLCLVGDGHYGFVNANKAWTWEASVFTPTGAVDRGIDIDFVRLYDAGEKQALWGDPRRGYSHVIGSV